MAQLDTQPASRQVLTFCPQCATELAVMRVIGGRAGAEYWTMRCMTCGGIHLDIIKPAAEPARTTEQTLA
jgi:uncharacterized Zn finger protein